MTDAPFTVRAAPPLDLLDVRLTGFLEPSHVAALLDALTRARRQLACPPGQHHSLYDISGCKLQSQQVLALMRAAMQNGRVARRLAVVAGKSLMRMQIRRVVVDHPAMRIFDDRQEAMLWLTRERMAFAKTGEAKAAPPPRWRTRQDSNLWPLPSEGSALSS